MEDYNEPLDLRYTIQTSKILTSCGGGSSV